MGAWIAGAWGVCLFVIVCIFAVILIVLLGLIIKWAVVTFRDMGRGDDTARPKKSNVTPIMRGK